MCGSRSVLQSLWIEAAWKLPHGHILRKWTTMPYFRVLTVVAGCSRRLHQARRGSGLGSLAQARRSRPSR
jgi:hypothetical protein